jgi:hypothetical protein
VVFAEVDFVAAFFAAGFLTTLDFGPAPVGKAAIIFVIDLDI